MNPSESPTPDPSSTTPTAAPAPLFQSPSRRRPPAQRRPLDEQPTSEALPAPAPLDVDSASDSAPAEETSASRPRGSDRPVPFAGKQAVQDAVGVGLRTATGLASARFAPPEAPDFLELTEQDEDALVPPVAGIVSRRVPTTVTSNPDLADAIAGAMALAVYVGRQLDTLRQVRKARRARAGEGEPLQQHEAADAGAPDLTA